MYTCNVGTYAHTIREFAETDVERDSVPDDRTGVYSVEEEKEVEVEVEHCSARQHNLWKEEKRRERDILCLQGPK